MNRHFNYEIDERIMRDQLKKMEMPCKEEAWSNYEKYYKQFNANRKTQLLPNFNFALNRTVVLPIIFGAVIISFSFLLFNFITIKTNKITSTNTSAANAIVKYSEIEKPKITPKVQEVYVVKKDTVKKTNSINTDLVIKEETSKKVVEAEKEMTSKPANEDKLAVTTSDDTMLDDVKKVSKKTGEKHKKKKRKKSRVEVLESIATPVSIPSLNQQNSEPELR